MKGTSVEQQKHKIYYSIGEVAKSIGVSASLIRFWEKELNIKPQHKDEKGNRKYKKSDFEKLKIVKKMIKEQGYTVKGVKANLANLSSDNKKKVEMLTQLTEIKGLLLYIKELL
jgi:DNA-binding transcriptional MerR regulator